MGLEVDVSEWLRVNRALARTLEQRNRLLAEYEYDRAVRDGALGCTFDEQLDAVEVEVEIGEDEPDLDLLAELDRRRAAYLAGEGKTLTLEELERELG